jgi:hypothetical protein
VNWAFQRTFNQNKAALLMSGCKYSPKNFAKQEGKKIFFWKKFTRYLKLSVFYTIELQYTNNIQGVGFAHQFRHLKFHVVEFLIKYCSNEQKSLFRLVERKVRNLFSLSNMTN